MSIEERNYWLQQLSPVPPCHLPLDFLRPGVSTPAKEKIPVVFDADLHAKIMKLTRDNPFLVYCILMANLKFYLYKYTGNPTVVVGSPVRKEEGISQAPNLVVLVDRLDPEKNFKRTLEQIRQTILASYPYQAYPYAKIIEDLGLDQSTNACPLVPVVLRMENIHEALPLDLQNDITLSFRKENEGLSGDIEFNASLFPRESIERFREGFLSLLRLAFEKMESPLGDLSLSTESGSLDRSRPPLKQEGAESEAPASVALSAVPRKEKKSTPPRSPEEQKMAKLWCNILGLKEIGMEDNFFDLGGHSLLAMQLISRINVLYKVDLPFRSLFDNPSLNLFLPVVEDAIIDELEKN